MDIETASEASVSSRFRRWLALLVGVAAVGAAAISTLQMDSSKREERALLRASRLTVEAFEKIGGSGILSRFAYSSAVEVIGLRLEGLGRALELTRRPSATPSDGAIAAAEIEAADRLEVVAASMSAVPADEAPLDDHATEVLAATTSQVSRIVEEENRQVDVAQRFGSRSSRAVFALSLLAISAVLLGLAGVLGEGRPGVIALSAAAGALVLSFGWGGSAILI